MQSTFLGLYDEFNQRNKQAFLKRYMIRHFKKQIINGSVALALPKSTTEVVKIEMTEWERETFKDALENDHQRVCVLWTRRGWSK